MSAPEPGTDEKSNGQSNFWLILSFIFEFFKI